MMMLLLWACQDEAHKSPAEADPVVMDTEADSLPSVTETEIDTASVADVDIRPARQLKRMTIPQVRDSMLRITGQPWGSETSSNWDDYAETLGVADYQLRVQSDRSPSVMFQKFLDDAAIETCLHWVNDPEGTFFRAGDMRELSRDNIRNLIVDLRWQVQGKSREPVAPIVDDYEILFNTAHQRTQELSLAWQTVCIALFTHPDFFMY